MNIKNCKKINTILNLWLNTIRENSEKYIMNRRWIAILVVFFICLSGLYFYKYRQYKRAQILSFNRPEKVVEDADYEKVVYLLDEGKTDEALTIIDRYKTPLLARTTWGKRWMDVLILALYQKEEMQKLLFIHHYFPRFFRDKEEVSIAVANELLSRGNQSGFERLREVWVNREVDRASWMNLDADYLMMIDRKQDAVKLLSSDVFEGKNDVGRLIRLALIHLRSDISKSWIYLDQALKKDPGNLEVRLFRGKLLESLGQVDMARSEYVATVASDQSTDVIRDQVAEFFVRYGQFSNALKIWAQALDSHDSKIWSKASFWTQVSLPAPIQFPKKENFDDVDKAYLNYLDFLKTADIWWSDVGFQDIPRNSFFLKNHQETFWLRVLEFIRKGDEKQAYRMLEANPFQTRSWAPYLDYSLRMILRYRIHGKLLFDRDDLLELVRIDEVTQGNKHFFFKELQEAAQKSLEKVNSLQLDPKLENLLSSDYAFTAAFLAANWREAALKLSPDQKIVPEQLPDWIAFEMTQAYRFNRGSIQALQFATMQKSSDQLSLLIASLMLESGNLEAAESILKTLSNEPTFLGRQAAYLRVAILMKNEKYDEAIQFVNSITALEGTIIKQELLAYIAFELGNTVEAEAIYLKIMDQSLEAKSYFARKAYKQGEYEKARKLTLELLRAYPNNIALRSNLKAILEIRDSEDINEPTP